MEKKAFSSERYVWISIIFFVLIIHFSPFCTSNGSSNKEVSEDVYFALLKESLGYIRSNYVDENKLSYKNLIHGAIKGMLESLEDDHTSFLDEKEFKDLTTVIRGSFGGLGIIISVRDDYPTVIAPIEDTPAYRLGIQPLDKIVEIEGKSAKGMKIEEVVNKLKGKPGTQVSIKIAREGALELIPLTITRAIIKVPSVKSGFIRKGLGYVKIISFGDKTTEELRKALLDLKRNGMKRLIVDLRNNPGGLLTAAIDVCNMFLDEGKVVFTRGRNADENRDFYADSRSTIVPQTIPLVVLVNEGSASASEIFAGAMQDTQRALVIGNKTFGKGSVQSVIPLRRSNEEIAMRLTIQKYYTPAERSIHGKGIEPDIQIDFPKKDFEELYMEKKLNDGKYISKFLKKNPKYNKGQVEQLMAQLETDGIVINRRLVEKYLRDEKRRKGGLQLFDLEYDIQLKKAVEVIDSESVVTKTVKVFK